jgi:nucleoside-diphosphate-sugar epimerase
MEGIDENVAYPDRPVNAYCESKQKAEELAKKANGTQLKTCILRPADIFGEGDPYHIGSLIDMAKDGFYVRLGNGKSVCQHVYVRNMAYAHILVAKAFTEKNRSIEGEVYFITDGPAHNFFKFYDQVVVGAGYKIWPSNLWLPFWLAFAIGGLIEFGAWLISPIKKVNPKFSRFAAVYTCSNFTFNSNKAKEDFGYIPKYATTDALSRTIEHYRKNRK